MVERILNKIYSLLNLTYRKYSIVRVVVNITDNNILELIKDKTFVLDIKQEYFEDLHNKKIKGFNNLKEFILTELNEYFLNYIDNCYGTNNINHKFMTKMQEEDINYLKKEYKNNQDIFMLYDDVFIIADNIVINIIYCDIENYYIIDVEYYYFVPFADTEEALSSEVFSFNII